MSRDCEDCRRRRSGRPLSNFFGVVLQAWLLFFLSNVVGVDERWSSVLWWTWWGAAVALIVGAQLFLVSLGVWLARKYDNKEGKT